MKQSVMHIAALLLTLGICQAASARFTDACRLGFSPDASGSANREILQLALDGGGTVIVSQPGVYPLSGTVYIGDDTTLEFCNGSVLKKVDENGPFGPVIKNRGAVTGEWNSHIVVKGLSLSVNGVQLVEDPENPGIRGLLAFYRVRDLRIEGFRCFDLGEAQYCIHVCKFEDLNISDAIIKGLKDGIHIGTGRRFHISDCVFQTADDAIALNGADYPTGQPEFGWIEEGLIENCHDLRQGDNAGAFFCRMLGGAWGEWEKGMEVQRGQVVVSGGAMYRVRNDVSWNKYKSVTRPDFTERVRELDGIVWERFQEDVTMNAGVRNVTVRNVFLSKPRDSFGIVIENSEYCRAYTEGVPFVPQENIVLDGIHVLYDEPSHFIVFCSPIPSVTVCNSFLRNNDLYFYRNTGIEDLGVTTLRMYGNTVRASGMKTLVTNDAPGKVIEVHQMLEDSDIPYLQ